ncbi:helix-turn-helix domain-containing protein [Caulobacter sp. KR2-114]|uniref:helix-turn-helix domain-containing protein n=1 Tax=Caulobacter sp. KR2-114 TaxID=3400912 RepID=UPI003BFB3E04
MIKRKLIRGRYGVRMPRSPSLSLARQARLLSTIIKTIRLERRMKSVEVAQRMGIALRTYEDFEAGRGSLDLEKVRMFGLATDTDAAAITFGLLFGSKETALRAMDNKFSSILWVALQEFEKEAGEQISIIPGRFFLESLRHAFVKMKEYLEKRDTSAERWLELEIQRLHTPEGESDSD